MNVRITYIPLPNMIFFSSSTYTSPKEDLLGADPSVGETAIPESDAQASAN